MATVKSLDSRMMALESQMSDMARCMGAILNVVKQLPGGASVAAESSEPVPALKAGRQRNVPASERIVKVRQPRIKVEIDPSWNLFVSLGAAGLLGGGGKKYGISSPTVLVPGSIVKVWADRYQKFSLIRIGQQVGTVNGRFLFTIVEEK